jgi:general secretion pathway protein D
MVRILRIAALVSMCFAVAAPTVRARPAPQTIDLRFAQTEMEVVLNALASAVGFNLIVGPNVGGKVDVYLSEVDWEVALNSIVEAHGYRYFWNQDVLVVLSSEESVPGGLEHRVVHLRYAEPEVVKNALVNALSAQGKIELVSGSATAAGANKGAGKPVIVLTETPQLIEGVVALIDSLDVPVPQFEIEVKFVETDLDDDLNVGFGWPTRIGASVVTDITNTDETETQTPSSARYPIPDGKIWQFGTLNVDQLSGFVEFLQQNGSARILSDPRVTVLENEKATMQVTTTIPVQTLNRFTEGAVIQDIVDFQDLDVGITLSVTPRLNADNRITLDVEPVVEEITGFTGPPDNQRPITAKRRVKTRVRVTNGETLVIGGLVKETKFATRNRVFFLGSIPILGALFTHKTEETQKTDLLMFITPRIVSDSE